MHSERRLVMLGYGKAVHLGNAGALLLRLLVFCSLTGAPHYRVRANESAECEHRTERADHRLHEAIEHHGWDSSKAEHARHELGREAREYCWKKARARHHRYCSGMLSGASGARNTTGTTTTGIHDKRGGRKYNC